MPKWEIPLVPYQGKGRKGSGSKTSRKVFNHKTHKLLHSILTFLPGIPSEDLKFEALTADSLRTEKGYGKATKKQQKELEAMRKKHSKERLLIQKQQCVAIEKLVKGKQ